MKSWKKFVSAVTLLGVLGTSSVDLSADDRSYHGVGYNGTRTAPSISPEVALGTIVVVATVAVLLHNRKQGHNPSNSGSSHGHQH